jgi:hypothetical protein
MITVDRRAIGGFLALMLAVNICVLALVWHGILAGYSDFPMGYSNAMIVRAGHASELYDYNAENVSMRRVSRILREPYNHLPFELLIYVPLTYFGYHQALLLWAVASVGMFGAVALLLVRSGAIKTGFALTFLAILSFFPAWFSLVNGQDSALLVLLFAISFLLWRGGRDEFAGFVLALALFRPQLVLPFVLVAFLAGKWKFVRGFIPGAVLVGLLSVAVVGFHGMGEYARILLAQGTEKSGQVLNDRWRIDVPNMPTWRGALSLCSSTWMSSALQEFLLVVGTILALLWATVKMRRSRNQASFDLAFAAALSTTLLFSFHSYVHDFSLLILPVLIFGAAFGQPRDIPRLGAYWLVTAGFVVFLTPAYVWMHATHVLGLFAFVEIAALWKVNRWLMGSLTGVPAKPEAALGA